MQLYAGHCIEPVIMNHAYMCEHETELNKKGEEDYMLVIDAIMWKYNYWTHMLTSLQQTIVYVHFIYLFSYVTLRFKLLQPFDICHCPDSMNDNSGLWLKLFSYFLKNRDTYGVW